MAPAQSRFLLFVKSGGNDRALKVKSGTVLNTAVFENPDLIRRLDITDDTDAIKEVLQCMTIQSIVDTLDGLGFAGLPSKPKKDPLIRTFLTYWDEIKGNVERLGGAVEAYTASNAPSQPASSSGEALGTVNVFSGTPHQLGDGEGYASDQPASIQTDEDVMRLMEERKKARGGEVSVVQSHEIKLKISVMDFRAKKDGYDFGTFEIKADVFKSVHTLSADIAEYLEKSIFRSGLSWKQVLVFEGQYLTNLIMALNYSGINEDNNGLTVEVYAEDDPRFMEIMTATAPKIEANVPQWTSDDEQKLQLARRLNQGAIRVDSDILEELEAKKKAWEESKAKTPASASDACEEDEQPVSDSEGDVEWAECSPQDLENEIEEEDLNPSETFPSDAKVKIIRVLKNKKDKRGFCLRMDVMNSDVEDVLAKLEDKDVIGDADDFHVFFNGQRVKHDGLLRSFFDDTKGYLRVRKLKGGGVVRKATKQAEREKRFRALNEKMVETTQGVGTLPEGVDAVLFKRCEQEILKIQSNISPASLGALVEKLDRNGIKAFYEATGNGELLLQERDVWKVAHCFLPILNELTACENKCDALKSSFFDTFNLIYGLACVGEGNRYSHTMLYDMVDRREKDIPKEEAKAAEMKAQMEAEFQKRMADLKISDSKGSGDVEMKR